jgi:uncharacterized protein with GYD domain
MAVFFMFGKYTAESRSQISAARTQQAIEAIEKLGGEVNAMHALLGPYDLLFCMTLPGIEDAIKASLALSDLTGVSFTTCPAVTVEVFDRLVNSVAR